MSGVMGAKFGTIHISEIFQKKSHIYRRSCGNSVHSDIIFFFILLIKFQILLPVLSAC